MKYRLSISEAAIEQLRALPRELRRNIGFRIESLCEDLQGDVKKLKGSPPRYRLRVGGYRILFTLAGQVIEVYAVKDRKDVYE
ncbi:MAG: type II toxin-antitoxin system RelE family toxin [Luteolibacter sp.]|jgi:mRNA-degrading endonuclease RelE of RelBE toxin-antitoxin system